jgi:hypothetical protein
MATFVFVVNDPAALTSSETGLRSFLTGLGHAVALVGPGSDATSVTGGTKPVVISEAISSAALSPTFKTVAVPLLTFEGGILVALGMSTTNSTAQSSNTLNFVANEPLTGGNIGSKQITVAGSGTPNMTMVSSYATKVGSGAKYLAFSGSGTTDLAAYYYPAGSTMADGTSAPSLRIFFGFRDQGVTNWFGDGVTAPGLSNTSGLPFVAALIAASAAAGGASVPAPIANAGADATVRRSSPVRLDGSGTPGNGGTLSYSWTQTAGPTVTLNGANTATPWFISPSADGALTFVVTAAETPGGRTDTDDVTITVSGTTRGSCTPPLTAPRPDGRRPRPAPPATSRCWTTST